MGTFIKMLSSIVRMVLKLTWKIVRFLYKPAWESLKDICRISWKLFKEKKAQKAASASESTTAAGEPSGIRNGTDLESGGTNS